MKRELLQSFYEYGATNERLFQLAEKLDATTFRRTIPGAGRSIYQLFIHMINTERGWLAGWKRQNEAPSLTEQDLPDLAAIRGAWARAVEDRNTFLASVSEEWLHEPMFHTESGKPVPYWKLILHVANHGTQHRAEIAAALTEIGFSPGDVDMVDYYDTL